MAAPLDEATVAVIQATVPALKAHGLAITTEMYRRLLETPEIRDLFNLSHQRDGQQPKALALAVLAYAEHIEDLGALRGMVERIAQKHVALNILPEHYPYVGTALLGAIADVLGEAATPEILSAWGKAYQLLAGVLTGREAQIYAAHESEPGGWRGWRSFRVRARHDEVPGVVSFELVPADGGALARHEPGQYLSFRLEVPGHGSQRRNYSISSMPGADHYRITVRRADGGVVSPWLHQSVQAGDTMDVSNPAGDFFLDEAASGPVVLLTAGSGATPAMSMLLTLTKGKPERPVRYIHAAHEAGADLFAPVIEALAARGLVQADLFRTMGAGDEPAVAGVTRHAGHITPDWVKANADPAATYYICGPDAFMREMVEALRSAGVPEERLRYEFFGSAADPALVL